MQKLGIIIKIGLYGVWVRHFLTCAKIIYPVMKRSPQKGHVQENEVQNHTLDYQ